MRLKIRCDGNLKNFVNFLELNKANVYALFRSKKFLNFNAVALSFYLTYIV
jgi:hypothetical protein